MKSSLLHSLLYCFISISLSFSQTSYPTWYEGGAPEYFSESPLPKGWPAPGPYFQVVRKSYPVTRAAVTAGSRTMLTFPRLFKHINKQEIKMTAPVVMNISAEKKSLKMEKMSFLYEDLSGSMTSTEKKVSVMDLPKETYLSYAWQGCDCEKKKKSVKEALFLHAAAMGVTLYDFRVLGYNSPSTPDEKQTWEMQARMK